MTNKKIVKRESKIQLDGIYKRGYGIIPKLVMEDLNLSVEAKAIYSYLCSYTGGSDNCYPSISLQCFHLRMTKNRYFKHRKLLEENGYIKIIKNRELVEFTDGTQREIAANNIYVLVTSIQEIEQIKNENLKVITKKVIKKTKKSINKSNTKSKNKTSTNIKNKTAQTIENTKFVQCLDFEDIENEELQNEYTNNNSINNNNNNTNKKEKRRKNNFDLIIELYTNNLELQKTLKDFIQHRFAIKKPLTDRALKLLLTSLNKLSEFDSEKIEIINYSITGGYSVFYPLKKKMKIINNNLNTQSNNNVLRFSNYNQREYDFKQLENDLIGWD